MSSTQIAPSLKGMVTATISLVLLFVSTGFTQNSWSVDLTSLIKKHATWDSDEFLLDKLKSNRILMISDAGHGDPLYMRTVTGCLNEWVSRWEKNPSEAKSEKLPSKLYLILEQDSNRTAALKRYFVTGNALELITPLIFSGGQFTTAQMEYYDDLRSLRQRIDAYNRAHADGTTIDFDIFGPEKVIDLSGWSIDKSKQYFINERDEYSSARIKELLDAHPDAKAVIFYGNSHSILIHTLKIPENPNSWGYFLAHYLSERYANDGGLYICGQVDVLASPVLDKGVKNVGRTFAVDQSIFNGVPIGGRNAFNAFERAAIYHFVPPRELRFFPQVYSRRLLTHLLDSVESCLDTSNVFYKTYVYQTFRYLCDAAVVPWYPLDARQPFALDSTIRAWKAWRDTSRADFVSDIASLDYFKRCVERVRQGGSQWGWSYEQQIAGLTGFKVWFQHGVPLKDRTDSLWAFIQRYRMSIITENLIPILWVGTKSEIEEAQAVLKRETGLDFKTAKEWASWWENKTAN